MPKASPSARKTAPEISIGVVGLGMGRHHCGEIVQVPGLKVATLCDVNAERLAAGEKDFGVKGYAEYERLLADPKVDLVVLATPHDTHCPLAVQGLQAGKHVIVEKVMCTSVAEADRMIAARNKSGKMLTVYQNRRWDADYVGVRQVVESGLIGDWFQVESFVGGYGPQGGWRADKEHGGGHFYDWGAHLFDQALLWGGAGAQVTGAFAHTQYRVWNQTVESHAHAAIRFDNGLLWINELSGITRIGRPRWRILGEKGSLEKGGFDANERIKVVTELAGTVAEAYVECAKPTWLSFYRNIAAHLLEGEHLAVQPEECRRAVAAICAAIRSAETGRVEASEVP